MSKSRYLLKQHTLSELFTVVYVLVDDYLKAVQASGHFELPPSEQQKGSYSELMAIALAGGLVNQADTGLWFNLIKTNCKELFPVLPDESRYYRVLNNLERIWADFALSLTAHHTVPAYSVDSKPLPVGRFKRHKRVRAMTQATTSFSVQGAVYGFKLHALTTPDGLIVFAISAAHKADVTVVRALLTDSERSLTLGDKAYLGCGLYTPPKTNAVSPNTWTSLMDTTRKLIESVFSSFTRTKYLVLGQRNSFRSIRAHTCRKIAAHNFACVFIL